MQCHFAVFRAHQMMNNMRAGCATSRVAEPFLANVAQDHGRGIGNSTVAARMSGELLRRKLVVVVFLGKLEIAETRSDSTDLVVDGLMFELVEAVQLKEEAKFAVSVTDKKVCE
jgi:hypothetical protein